MIAAIAGCVKQAREGNGSLLITHACSSSTNAVTWGDTINILRKHWARDPYEKAIRAAEIRAHNTDKSYQLAFKLKSDLPSKGLYYITKVLGNKKQKADAKELVQYVAKCKQIGL
jgi:hypothetical protein